MCRLFKQFEMEMQYFNFCSEQKVGLVIFHIPMTANQIICYFSQPYYNIMLYFANEISRMIVAFCTGLFAIIEFAARERILSWEQTTERGSFIKFSARKTSFLNWEVSDQN